MSDAQKRQRTIVGLVLIAAGIGLAGVLHIWLRLPPDKYTVAGPLGFVLIGAWVLYPDQVGPLVRDLGGRLLPNRASTTSARRSRIGTGDGKP